MKKNWKQKIHTEWLSFFKNKTGPSFLNLTTILCIYQQIMTRMDRFLGNPMIHARLASICVVALFLAVH